MKTLIIDNYDSFTFNLYQSIGKLGGVPIVYKNDQISLEEIENLSPTHLIISPGPGTVEKAEDFGICSEAIHAFKGKIPILGVCLGHQGIASQFGATITSAPQILHGKRSIIEHDGENLFKGVKNPFMAMRYHSLCVDEGSLPEDIIVTARVASGAARSQPISPNKNTIMGLRHRQFPLFGLQFHPESFGTPEGSKLLANFLEHE